jgi:mono/diheme cytochrome c family protein
MTNLKKISFALFALAWLVASCGDDTTKKPENTAPESSTPTPAPEPTADEKGIGKFQNVELTHPLDQSMVKAGEKVYDVKCSSCHKLSDERIVGPGWKGVTTRRKPEWIMNFVTNVEEMLNKDPEAQAMLEVCMVRMPNQNLSDQEARAVLEYMRHNDGEK